MKSIIYKSLVLLAVGSFLSCKKDTVQHPCSLSNASINNSGYSYTYDAQGRVTAANESNGDGVTLSYGANNTVTMVSTTNGSSVTANGVLNSHGNLISLTAPNYTYQLSYDNNDRLLSFNYAISGSNYLNYTYTYNGSGDVTSITQTTHSGATTVINITEWTSDLNPGGIDPVLFTVNSTYKIYGKFSNHLPKTINIGTAVTFFTYSLNANGYIDSFSTLDNSTGNAQTNSFTQNCN